MTNHFKIVTFLFMFVLSVNIATAKEPVSTNNLICKLLKKEKGSVVYLLDEHGKVSKGPIHFGHYGYTNPQSDFYYIPTKYRLVISPLRLVPASCFRGNCLELKSTESVCPNSKTYSVSYTMQNWPQNEIDRSWLPYKVNDSIFISIEDPELDLGEPDIKFRFELRVVGEIYDATKK